MAVARSAVPAIAILCALMLLGLQPARAQTNGGYDPRTWSYDDDQEVLLSPSQVEAGVPAAGKRQWARIEPEVVRFAESLPKGSILIKTGERRLYYLLGNGKALKYAVGVGKEGLSWTGQDRISDKKHWPDWRPPAEMIAREAANGRKLPVHVSGGPNNPLGARALYIGTTLYRIHGTNQPWTVGQANSSGCIRMVNEDVIDLFERVDVGAQVIVRH